jgi:hypothetical protein
MISGFFPPPKKKCAICEIMWKYGRAGRPQVTVQ